MLNNDPFDSAERNDFARKLIPITVDLFNQFWVRVSLKDDGINFEGCELRYYQEDGERCKGTKKKSGNFEIEHGITRRLDSEDWLYTFSIYEDEQHGLEIMVKEDEF